MKMQRTFKSVMPPGPKNGYRSQTQRATTAGLVRLVPNHTLSGRILTEIQDSVTQELERIVALPLDILLVDLSRM